MNHSQSQGSASDDLNPENGTPGRYTCYDTGTFLALYIVLGTTCTVDIASEAFEQSEKMSRAHPRIQITDAHEKLARRPSRKERRGTAEDQAAEKGKGRMRKWLEKVVRNLEAE